jgi:hypothetical protein
VLNLINNEGIMFSCNDSKEKSFCYLYEMAYFLYRKLEYAAVIKTGQSRELLYGVSELPDTAPGLFNGSSYFKNGGLAVLRSKSIQAVLKFGTHGGYHGHFDRISLLSVMRGSDSFYNCMSAWFGYDSFLFKMWVQTSLAHNMVVVNRKMQKPSTCDIVLFCDERHFKACAAETVTQWSDPPYGGQTPYPLSFPDEKCDKEGRYIIPPEIPRKQGDIGEYSEPVFQRRMVIVTDEYILVADYIQGTQSHEYDCLYHPEGVYDFCGTQPEYTGYTDRFDDNPFGSGQFITNCHHYKAERSVKISFGSVNIFHVYPCRSEFTIAKFPESTDTFKPEEITLNKDINKKAGRKTVAFRQQGTEARFITILEPFTEESAIQAVECEVFGKIKITLRNDTVHYVEIKNMDCKENCDVKIDIR